MVGLLNFFVLVLSIINGVSRNEYDLFTKVLVCLRSALLEFKNHLDPVRPSARAVVPVWSKLHQQQSGRRHDGGTAGVSKSLA